MSPSERPACRSCRLDLALRGECPCSGAARSPARVSVGCVNWRWLPLVATWTQPSSPSMRISLPLLRSTTTRCCASNYTSPSSESAAPRYHRGQVLHGKSFGDVRGLVEASAPGRPSPRPAALPAGSRGVLRAFSETQGPCPAGAAGGRPAHGRGDQDRGEGLRCQSRGASAEWRWLDACDCGVVVGNDSDIAEAMRLVRRHRGIRIGLVTPGTGRPSRQLMAQADFSRHGRANGLRHSQLPDPIPGTNIRKPAAW